jgi:hypothetical protein
MEFIYKFVASHVKWMKDGFIATPNDHCRDLKVSAPTP